LLIDLSACLFLKKKKKKKRKGNGIPTVQVLMLVFSLDEDYLFRNQMIEKEKDFGKC